MYIIGMKFAISSPTRQTGSLIDYALQSDLSILRFTSIDAVIDNISFFLIYIISLYDLSTAFAIATLSLRVYNTRFRERDNHSTRHYLVIGVVMTLI